MRQTDERRRGGGCVPARPVPVTTPRNKGQVWSLDYTAGFLLFLLALLIVIGTLFRTTLGSDGFAELASSTDALSEKLMGPGYPSDWRPATAVSIGLLTDDQLSMRKAERLGELAEQQPAKTKNLLDTREDYAITFQERNGSHVAIGDRCALGSADVVVQKSVGERREPIAYYSRTGAEALLAEMQALNATTFTDDEFAMLLENISDYQLVVLEEPDLGSVARPYDAEKASALEEYVTHGGDLLLIGDPNLSEAFSLNLTLLGSTMNATGGIPEPDLLNLSGTVLESLGADDDALGPPLPQGTSVGATLDDGRLFAAAFPWGDGDVTFLGGLDGSVQGTGETLATHIVAAIANTTIVPYANCTNVTLPVVDAKNFVTIRRLVAFKGDILIMSVSAWVRP